jgi:hypothetical protein
MEALFPLESLWVVALASGAIALAMLLLLARALPAQNLVMIIAGLLAGGGLLQFLMFKIDPVTMTGPMWCFLAGGALLWLAIVLSARKLAQIVLRPWRGNEYYGLWLIAATALETAVFQFGWPSLNPDDIITPRRAMFMAVIRALGTAILLAALTPWFIRKRPVSRADRSELAQQPENQAEQNADEQTSG